MLTSFQHPILTGKQHHLFLNHAKQLLDAQQSMMAIQGKSLLHHTLRDHERHIKMKHYPQGDRIDHTTGAQYFYHCHRENYEHHEHGHFHCFLRYPHIPKQIKPVPLKDWDKYFDNPMTHLIAISMNLLGEPIRLFTVNRWVSSEIWYNADSMPKILKRFKMTLSDDPYWTPLDQWIESMLIIFKPQITWLYQMRDLAVKAHGETVYHNQSIEELSSIDISLKQQIEWILHG